MPGLPQVGMTLTGCSNRGKSPVMIVVKLVE